MAATEKQLQDWVAGEWQQQRNSYRTGWQVSGSDRKIRYFAGLRSMRMSATRSSYRTGQQVSASGKEIDRPTDLGGTLVSVAEKQLQGWKAFKMGVGGMRR